jgi:hypothetical protein
MGTMWSVVSETGSDRRLVRFVLDSGGAPLRFSDVLGLMRDSAPFREFFSVELASAPFRAFRWETPPVTAASVDRAFECVLIDSPDLSDSADALAFSRHFDRSPSEDVVVFPNLAHDATLVVPRPIASPAAYPHLAAFLRAAPSRQQHALWAAVGGAMAQQIGSDPIWLNTAGGGVPWLHVRVDTSPKYYRHGPYRRPPAE